MNLKSIAVLSLAVFAAFSPASAQNTFKLATTLISSAGVSSGVAQVIATDVNGDGKSDLICANTVLTNNGKGVLSQSFFSPSISIRTSGFMTAGVMGNGRVDLITLTNLTVSPFTESIVVYTNSGPTGFSGGISFGIHSSTVNVGNENTNNSNQAIGQGYLSSAGDVFGNGRANLFYLSSVSNSLSLYTNNGGGIFGSNANFGVKLGLPAVADVNRDGKVDFITPSYTNNLVFVFTNSGGIYGSNASFKVRSPVYVVAADVNGDGWADLIVGSVTNNNANQYTNTIAIWTNNGSGTFGSNTSFTVGSVNQRVMDIKAAPVFSDGQMDLIFAVSDLLGNTANTLMVYTNNGFGGFGSNTAVSVGSSTLPASVAVADVSGDGALDLISANAGSGTLTIFTNTGVIPSGSFVSNSMPVVGTNTFFVLAADLYRTGQSQLLTLNNGGAQFVVLTNNGSGLFGSNAVISGFAGANSFVQGAPIAADIFGNGSPALVIGLENIIAGPSGSLVIMTNNGSGIFATNSSINTGLIPNAIAAADVNGDGKLDLIAACYNSSGSSYSLIVLTNNGAGGFGTNVTLTLSAFSHLAVADVNADGRPDLLTVASIGGFSKLTVFTNISATGTGQLYSSSTTPPNFLNDSTTYQMTLGANPSGLVVVDVNNDGKPDVIIANANNPGTLTVMTNTGFINNSGNAYTFVLASSPAVGAYPNALVAADINGDGKMDLISANWGVTTNTVTDLRGPLGYGTLTVLTNSGNSGIFTNVATFSTGPGPNAVIASDVNFDGKLDLITANYTSFTNTGSVIGTNWYGHGNSLSILLNTSNFVNTVVLQTAPTDSPITYGQTLTNANLTGGAVTNEAGVAVTGTFTFTTNSLLSAGTPNVPVTFTPAPPTDFQPITFNVSVTVSQLVAVLKGKRAYDGTTNVAASFLSVSNKVGSDNVTVSAGSVGLNTANVGTNIFTSTNGLVLGGSTAVNYTLNGVNGSVVITQALNNIVLTSTMNPAGLGVALNFNATLPAYASGTIQFLTNTFVFDAQTLAGGTATSVADATLPQGSNTIAAVYSGDANNQSVTNYLGQIVNSPTFSAPIFVPTGTALSGSFGKPGQTYYILASTNLALPIGQWLPIYTNTFDLGGNYSFTNPLTADPDVYFILKVP
jgi:hypothetical protein